MASELIIPGNQTPLPAPIAAAGDLAARRFVEFFTAHEYDVWLFDYRASPALPACRTQFTLDDIAANVGLEMSGTVLGTFDSVKGSVMDAWRRYVDLVGVREENERLRAQVAELQARIVSHGEEAYVSGEGAILIREQTAPEQVLTERL